VLALSFSMSSGGYDPSEDIKELKTSTWSVTCKIQGSFVTHLVSWTVILCLCIKV